MTPADILRQPPRVLTTAQREAYFRDGFVSVEALIPPDWIDRLVERSDALLEASREISQSNEAYDLGPSHTAERPHVRRLRAVVDRDPVFWRFAKDSLLADVAADLVGPDVKFHSAKLNYKWPGAGETVKWHQDIQAWPHTNYSPVTLGVHLAAVTTAQGPLVCIPGSHDGPLFFHTDATGEWTGAISDEDLGGIDLERGVATTGPAGTLVALNCRTVHGSAQNTAARPRPLLLNIYSSADAFPWMPAPTPTTKTGRIVRGRAARVAHLDPRPCPVPPDWAEVGYNSIFAAQQEDAPD
ncbi:MAG: phytanoyl-CoA dioxygenase family protein [Alphaproteobacteria bacterium]|jgi:hypothetical protein|nr:phytanoyl-CoA dioxygenase family protein [Alphaproteobacteria bacterium]